MRVTELFHGLGLGGAEVAAYARLEYAPKNVSTSMIISGETRVQDPSLSMAGVGNSVISCESSANAIWEAVQASEPDLLVVNTPRHLVQLASRVGSKRSFGVVAVAHGAVVSDRPILWKPLAWYLRRVNPVFDLHIAVSKSAAGGPWCRGARRVAICHLGSQLHPASDAGSASWPEGTNVKLLTLSRLTKPKNLRALTEAVFDVRLLLRNEGAHLNIVGGGPEGPSLERHIRDLGIGDIVTMTGPTPTPGDWLRDADWLLIPSIAEGGPLTVYESALAGTRVMSTRCGAAPDVLNDDADSILVRGFSRSELARSLGEAILRGALESEERRERAERSSVWSIEVRSREWYQLLRMVANQFSSQ